MEGPFRAPCKLKKPFKGSDTGVAGRKGREKYFAHKGNFEKDQTEKIKLMARPDVQHGLVQLRHVLGRVDRHHSGKRG